MAYSRPGVYITERLIEAPVNAGATANAAGAVVAPFARGPETVTRVTSAYEFSKVYGPMSVSYPATFGVNAFFQNGGTELYVRRVLHSDATAATVNLLTSGSAVVATITAKHKGADGNNLRVTIAAGSSAGKYDLKVYKERVAGTASNVANDDLLESYDNVVFSDPTSSDFAESVINTISANIVVSASTSGTPVSAVYPLTSGTDGTAAAEADYTDVFGDLSILDRPLVVFMPALWDILSADQDTVYNAATSWADEHGSFVIVETDSGITSTAALNFVATLDASSNAAAYYPYYYISDPVGRTAGTLRLVGPAGAIAGKYLATDAAKGPFKAPAGLTTTITGAVAIEKSLTSTELDSLNTASFPINPIRQIPGTGFAVMGARTLLQDGTANKYINMRRSLNYIRKSLENITLFALFENNDERLWNRLNTVISVFLNDYRNAGGLRGNSATEAFFVKVDAENNTAQSIPC